MKFEQHWHKGFRGKSFEILSIFQYKCMAPIQTHRDANITLPWKGQMPMYDHYFSNFGRPPMICAKIQPQGTLGSGEEDFLKVFTTFVHMGMAAILVNGPQPFSNISFPQPKEAPYEIWAKLAQQQRWSFENVNGRDEYTDGGGTKSDHYSSSRAELRWAKKKHGVQRNIWLRYNPKWNISNLDHAMPYHFLSVNLQNKNVWWTVCEFFYMSQSTTKYTIWLVRPAKISLCILAVWSESSLIALAFYSIRAIDEQEALLHWMGVQADLSICWSSKSYCSLLKCLDELFEIFYLYTCVVFEPYLVFLIHILIPVVCQSWLWTRGQKYSE